MLACLLALTVTAAPTPVPADPWFEKRDAALAAEMKRLDAELLSAPATAPTRYWLWVGGSAVASAGFYTTYFLNQSARAEHVEQLRTPLGGLSQRPPEPLNLDFMLVPAFLSTFSLMLSSVVTFAIHTNNRDARERLLDERADYEWQRGRLRREALAATAE